MPLDGTLHPFVGLPGATPNMNVSEVGFDAREVWMGANYALAATFIEAGKRFGLADLTATGLALAKGLDYQVYSPSSPGKGAFVFNEPNAYYAGDPRITRGPGMSRNLAAWDLLKAAAMASGTSGTKRQRTRHSAGRPVATTLRFPLRVQLPPSDAFTCISTQPSSSTGAIIIATSSSTTTPMNNQLRRATSSGCASDPVSSA